MLIPGFLLFLAILIAPLIAWLVSEFRGGRAWRIGLGILAMGVMTTGIWTLNTLVTRFNYNAWYGGATGDLINTSLHEIEDGHLDRVLKVWRGLQQQYRPTYENRAHYDEWVKEATARMRGTTPIEVGLAWDASIFGPATWLGHWEDGFGYWIVISGIGRPFSVLQSGQRRAQVHDVSVSPDFRVLKFKEGDQWLHTLTLKNKYEASYEWVDLQKGTVWETRTAYKLIRATDAQKAMTQQDGTANQSQPIRPATNHPSAAAGADPGP